MSVLKYKDGDEWKSTNTLAVSEEPEAYLKSAAVDGNTLTLTNKDDTTISFTPSGGSGGGGYTLPVASKDTLGGVKVELEPRKITVRNPIGAPLIYNEETLSTAYIPMATTDYAGAVMIASSGNGLYNNELGSLDVKKATTTNLGTVAYDGITIKQNNNNVKQLYVPNATTSTLGIVKPDGNTITITADGTISAPVAANRLIGKSMSGYDQPASEWGWIADWAQHPEKYYVVVKGTDIGGYDCPVIYTYVYNKDFYYTWFENNILHSRSIEFTDNTLSQVKSVSQYADGGVAFLTDNNWNNYIAASNWQKAAG